VDAPQSAGAVHCAPPVPDAVDEALLLLLLVVEPPEPAELLVAEVVVEPVVGNVPSGSNWSKSCVQPM
jgi:hypothetical protein